MGGGSAAVRTDRIYRLRVGVQGVLGLRLRV